ncbi:MAG: DUF4340 domain-containing protein [Bacteroidales bacterium]|nr:DUF4340 domain-containing protein [Bacteroidales bacterium]
MKRNKTIVIVIILIAVGAFLAYNHHVTTDQSESAEYRVLDTASVTKVYLADRLDHETLLERTDHGWILNQDYKAHPKKIDQLFNTLYRVRVSRPVSLSSHDNVIVQMASRSTKVEIYQMVPRINILNKIKLLYHEKRTRVFYVGEATMDNVGTFMLREGSDEPVIVHIPGFQGYISTRFTANPDDWRDHTIFHETLANIKSASVEFGDDATRSFRIENTGHHQYQLIRLADNQSLPIDTLKVINFLSAFNDIRFEALINDITPQPRLDSIRNSQFLHRITLVNKEGKTVSMRTYPKRQQTVNTIPEEERAIDVDRMYAFINDDRDFVLVQYYTFDKLIKDVNYYVAGNPIQLEIEYYQVLQ